MLHFGWRSVWAGWAYAGLLLLSGLALGLASPARGNPVYTVANLPVAAEAADAVMAKEQAMEEGRERAFRMLLLRLTPFRAHDRLPQIDGQALEELVDGVIVREEGYSSTRYVARIDFSFRPRRIKDLLNRFGITFTDRQASARTVVPAWSGPGEDGARIWRTAWQGLDLDSSLAPVKLVSDRDMGALPIASIAAGQAMEQTKYQLRAEHIVLAGVQISEDGSLLRLNLSGEDEQGRFASAQNFRIYDGDMAEAAGHAARVALGIIEARWRLASLAGQGAFDAPAELMPVAFTATFSSLREWQDLRAEITSLPGAQDVEVKSLFAGGAAIQLNFPGGAERLAQTCAARGLSLSEVRGQLVLRRP
jgi:hypothetical protein